MIALAKLLTVHAQNWNELTVFVLLALIVCIGRMPVSREFVEDGEVICITTLYLCHDDPMY
jgi:hypothetical protein